MKIVILTVAALLCALPAIVAVATEQHRSASSAFLKSCALKAHCFIFGAEPVQGMTLGSNTLTGLIPTFYAALDKIARERVGMIPAAWRDSKVEMAAVGQQITSPIAPSVTAADITPGVTAPNDGDQVFGSKPFTISKSRYVPIRWNGEEQKGLGNQTGPGGGWGSMFEYQCGQAMRTLCNEMETDLVNAGITGASRAVGTPGTTPFGVAGDLSDFALPLQILEDNGTAAGMNRMVVNSNSMAKLRGKQSVLFKANEAGTDELLRRGVIGEVESFLIGNSAQAKQFIKGTGTGYVTSGTLAVGTTAISLVTGSGTVKAGDVVTFAGDANQYVVNVGTNGAGTIQIGTPGLRLALAAGSAMTIGNSYTPNIAFAQEGIFLATRIPATPVDAQGRAADMADDRTIITDPFSGLSFEFALYRQYRQIKYEVGIAWGVGVPKSDFVALLLG